MKKENQSHRSEHQTSEKDKQNPIVISQEELIKRKKKAEAQIYETINQMYANEDLTTTLLIDEKDIPESKLLPIPSHKVYPFVIPSPSSFFGQKTTRPDFRTLYKTHLYQTRINLNNKKCYYREDVKKSIILPTLCKDNILYCKEGEFLHQISLDEKNPRFVTRNILTKKDEFLCEGKMSEILSSWLEEEKAYELYNKLSPLYNEYTQGKIQPLQIQTLPTPQQVYILNVYKTGYETKFHLTNNVYDNNFLMLPTVCDSKKIISKAGDRYYKIDFNDEYIRFEKLIKEVRYLMTSSEMNTFLNGVYKSELFGTKTGIICAWLKSYYNKEIAPLCQDNNLVPANEVDKRISQRQKIKTAKGFDFITEFYTKNTNQNENK